MKKTLINWLGLLGVVGLLSYTAGVVFSPLAYPGYDWKAQAVSDLFAMNAPSLLLWNQLTSLCSACIMVSVMSFLVGEDENQITVGNANSLFSLKRETVQPDTQIDDILEYAQAYR